MRTRRPHLTRTTLCLVACCVVLPASAHADPPACGPDASRGAVLRDDIPSTVVFGRSVTVTAAVGLGIRDARLELLTASGTLLTVRTTVSQDPDGPVIRIFDFPAPRGGTSSLTARLSFVGGRDGAACRAVATRTIRLVPGRLGRVRVDHRPGAAAITIRTAAGEGCQDYLRTATVRVRLTDVTGTTRGTEILENTHPCDGWATRSGTRSPHIRIDQTDSNLILRSTTRPNTGTFRLIVTRSGRLITSGTLHVETRTTRFRNDEGATTATYTPDTKPRR